MIAKVDIAMCFLQQEVIKLTISYCI